MLSSVFACELRRWPAIDWELQVLRKTLNYTFSTARRIAIAVVGISVLAIGFVMVITPGPAIVMIPLGLAILGLEFAWARSWLRRLRRKISGRNAKERAERAMAHQVRVSESIDSAP